MLSHRRTSKYSRCVGVPSLDRILVCAYKRARDGLDSAIEPGKDWLSAFTMRLRPIAFYEWAATALI